MKGHPIIHDNDYKNDYDFHLDPQSCPHCIKNFAGAAVEKPDGPACSKGDKLQISLENLSSLVDFILELGLAILSGACTLVLSIIWIAHCLFTGRKEDPRVHQAETTSLDGLKPETRDAMTSLYNAKLARRAEFLKEIDLLRNEWSLAGDDLHPDCNYGLMTIRDREDNLKESRINGLREVVAQMDHELADYENVLRWHKMG